MTMERTRVRPAPFLSTGLPTLGLLASGCDAFALGIELAPDVGPVAVAGWTETIERSRVVVSTESGPWLQTEWQEPSEVRHEHTLLGLYPEGQFAANVVTEGGAESQVFNFSTPSLPADFPGWSTDGSPSWDGYMVTSLLSDPPVALVLDEQARVVWFHTIETTGRVLRARLRQDGQGVRYAVSLLTDETKQPQVDAVDWRGNVTSQLDVPYFSHDFVEKTDGTLALLLFDVRKHEAFDGDVYGNELVELTPEGTSRAVWSTWNTWDPTRDGQVQDDGTWTHGNSLDVDEETGTYTAGFRGVDAIVEIDAASGATLRQVGGPTSTYAFASEQDQPYDQHQFQWVDGGILIFDNHTEASGSRALELALDDVLLTATPANEIRHEPEFWVYAMGDVDRDGDGGTLISWATSGVISEVGSNGETRWELAADLGTATGFVTREHRLPGVERIRASN